MTDIVNLENRALFNTHDFPIRRVGDVKNGKVRSAYWLTKDDSVRLSGNHDINPDADLGVMIISDRISAYDEIWKGENNLNGVPGKGASLNIVSQHWFNKFDEAGLAGNHILATPHPLVWIVQKAEPVMIEGIVRAYITGSMWDKFTNKHSRQFCGIRLSDKLTKNEELRELMLTPTTKGVAHIRGLHAKDDTNITAYNINKNFDKFGLKSRDDIAVYERLLIEGFNLISKTMASKGEIFVDTKFELGYIKDKNGEFKLIYIDEIGTADSSRYWNSADYAKDRFHVTELSKEGFRQFLKAIHNPIYGNDIFTNKSRHHEVVEIAKNYRVPVEQMMKVSDTYADIAEKITGKPLPKIENAREEILAVLSSYGLLN